MPDGTDGGVTFTLDGAHLRVDARPARLVSMLRHGDGPPVVTAQPSSGEAKVEQLPDGARQATFQVRDDVTVEATQAATFVAVADDSGRCLVIAYSGELTVVPGGDDRFALGADEALVVNGPGVEPAVVPVAELSAGAHPDVAALLDATTDALFAPAIASTVATEAPSEAVAAPEERTAEVAPTNGDKPADGPAKKAAPQKNGGAKKAAAGAAAAGAGGGAGAGGRRKKGKKGRPQPQKAGAAKKAPVAGGAAAAAAGGAGAAAATSGAKKAPVKATGGGGKQPPREPAKTGGGGGGGGGHDDDSYEDTPRDRRFLVGAVLVALVLAVGAVLLLSQVGDDGTEVATGATTTTVDDDEVADTTTSSTTPATTTTAPASTTTTSRATTTTAQVTTTTARATTTTQAAQPKYSIEPKSCVQNGNTITYTAAVENEAAVAYDFTVDVSFKTSDGTEVAKGTATVSKLGAGRTADFSASGTSSRTLAGTGASCEVIRVDARPSA